MLTRFHSNQYHSPCISVASTDKELLDWIKSVTNVGRIISKKNYNKEKHKGSFTYRVIYNDALTLLEAIETYLVINRKKSRAKLILENYKQITPRNGKYNDELRKKKEDFYKDFMTL